MPPGLETFGYQVYLASDGAQGVESFRQAKEKGEPFDLVLMDLAMPKMDGRAASKAILGAWPQRRASSSPPATAATATRWPTSTPKQRGFCKSLLI